MFRSGDIVDQSNGYEAIAYFMYWIPPHATRGKADSQVAIFADHEWANYYLGQMQYSLEALGYDKPANEYFPRRHTQGPVVAYTDGHAAVFQDEKRKKTWGHDNPGKYSGNQTDDYGNGWAMLVHIFDEQ